MAESVVDRVRTSCAEAAAGALLVRVNEPALSGYAAELARLLRSSPPGWAAPQDLPPWPNEARAALVVALDAINFGSGWHPLLDKDPDSSGARTVRRRFIAWAEDAGPSAVAAERLAEATPAEVRAALGQAGRGSEVDELMALFAAGLADLGRFVAERAGGSFTALIEAADSSAASLADRLVELAQYRDCAEHDGRAVWLAKRAQITAADLHDAFAGAGLGRFHDLARLTMFADNLVPHVLALDGVLAVDPELRAAITREELLPAGGRAEVELRAAAVHAVERLTAEPALRAGNTTAMQLDHLLWRRGGGARYKATPRHRTRCTFY